MRVGKFYRDKNKSNQVLETVVYEILEQRPLSEGLKATKYRVYDFDGRENDYFYTLRKSYKKAKGWGYFNSYGELEIPGLFSQAGDFKNGLAVVGRDGVNSYHGNSRFVIKRDGSLPPGSPYSNRIIRLSNNLFVSERGRSRTGKSRIFYRATLRDENFQEIRKSRSMMAAKGLDSEYAKVFAGGETRVFDSKGNLVYKTKSKFSNVQIEDNILFDYSESSVKALNLDLNKSTKVNFSEEYDFRLRDSHR